MYENNQTIFSPKFRAIFFYFQKRALDHLPLVVRLYWSDENTKN